MLVTLASFTSRKYLLTSPLPKQGQSFKGKYKVKETGIFKGTEKGGI